MDDSGTSEYATDHNPPLIHTGADETEFVAELKAMRHDLEAHTEDGPHADGSNHQYTLRILHECTVCGKTEEATWYEGTAMVEEMTRRVVAEWQSRKSSP